MRICDLKAFVEVADLGSFVKAAEKLHISQPALSRRISKLEYDLGSTLLIRTNRSVEITDSGKEFLLSARKLLAIEEAARRKIHALENQTQQSLKVAAIPSIVVSMLPGIFSELNRTHSDMAVSITDGNMDVLNDALENGSADFIIGMKYPCHQNFTSFSFAKESLGISFSSTHPLAKKKKVSLKDLEKYPIVYNANGGNWITVNEILKPLGCTPNWLYETVTPVGGMALVNAGIGIAFSSQSYAQGFMADSLMYRDIEGVQLTRDICLTRRKNEPVASVAAEMMRLILEAYNCEDQLPQLQQWLKAED